MSNYKCHRVQSLNDTLEKLLLKRQRTKSRRWKNGPVYPRPERSFPKSSVGIKDLTNVVGTIEEFLKEQKHVDEIVCQVLPEALRQETSSPTKNKKSPKLRKSFDQTLKNCHVLKL